MDRLRQIKPESTVEVGKEVAGLDEAETDKDSGSQVFFAQIRQAKGQINSFSQNTTALKGMHDMLLRTLDPNETANLQRTIEEKTLENNKLGQETGRLLKELTEQTQDQERKRQITPSVARIRFNLATSCSSNFARQIQTFQQMELRAKAEYGEHLKRQYLIVNPKATAQQLEQVVQGGAIPEGGMFESANRMEAQRALDSLKDRHKSIQKLEKSLVDLHRLFVDMQMLVQLQGKMIDRIDTNVENVAEYTGEAAGTMEKAVEYQKAAWKKRMIFMIVALILIVAVILFVLKMVNVL